MAEKRTTRQNYVNVSEPERWISVISGGVLIAYGMRKRSWSGFALAALGGAFVRLGATGHSYTYQALGIHTASRSAGTGVPYELGVRVDAVVTINRQPEELYRFWRDLENLPQFMKYISTVSVIDDKRSHWVARGPAGKRVEWDAEIINDIENELIGWRSLPGSDVDSGGSVRFEPAPGRRGTEVRVSLQYNLPGGSVGAVFAKLTGQDPKKQIQQDLRRLKQLMETGEIPTTEGQPAGRKTVRNRNERNNRSERVWPANQDPVNVSSEESFPASDAPSWTPGSV